MEQAPGVFVSVDGPCGVGKSTTIRALGERLRAAGLPLHLTAEPTDSDLGALARARVHSDTCGHALACLFAADRYQHLKTENVLFTEVAHSRDAISASRSRFFLLAVVA